MDVVLNPPFRKQQGVSLIEALIAVVVLSIGLLGIAGLHTSSMKTGANALNRSKAIMLADDLYERMLANRQVLTSYNWGAIAAASEPGIAITSVCYEATATNIDAGCVPNGLAAADRVQWTELLQHRDFGLPSGAAAITVTVDSGSLFNISIVINWADGTRTDQYTFNAVVNGDV